MNAAERADPILKELTDCGGDKETTTKITETSNSLVATTGTNGENLPTEGQVRKESEATSGKEDVGFETSCPSVGNANLIEGQQMILPNNEEKKRDEPMAALAAPVDQATSANISNSTNEAILGIPISIDSFTSTNATVPVPRDDFAAGNVTVDATTDGFTSDNAEIPSISAQVNEVGAPVDTYATPPIAAPPAPPSFLTISSNVANPEISSTPTNAHSIPLPNVPNAIAPTNGYFSSNGPSSVPGNAPNAAPIDPFVATNAPSDASGNTPNAVSMNTYVSTNAPSPVPGNATDATASSDVYINNTPSAAPGIEHNVAPINSYVSTNALSGTSGSAPSAAPIDAYASTNAPSAASGNGPDAASMDAYISTNNPSGEGNTPAPMDAYVSANAPFAAPGNGPDSASMDVFMSTNAPSTAPVNRTNALTAMHPYNISTHTRNAAPGHSPTPAPMDAYGSTNVPSAVPGNRSNVAAPIGAYVTANTSSTAPGNVSNAAPMNTYVRTNAPSGAPGNLPIVPVPMDSYGSTTNAPSRAPVNGPNLSMDGYVSASAPSAAPGNASNGAPMNPYVSVDAGHAAPSNDAFAPIDVATPAARRTEFSTSHNEAPVSFTPTNASNSTALAVSYASTNTATHSAASDVYTPISIGNQVDAYAPANAPTHALTSGGYNTVNAATQVDLYNTSTNAVAPEFKMVTDSFHSPQKKPRLSNSSVVEPMGELRPTDILAGNYRKRIGNALYKTLLRQYAPEVGKTEMKTIVAKVFDTIANQNPPGRFIREGGDALMSRAQTNQKIARALREVADRASAKLMEEGGEGLDLAFAGLGDRRLSKALSTPKGEPVGEIRQSDVLTGNYRKRPGNALYKRLLRENAPLLEKIETKVLVTRVIEGIAGQEPPGRFIREGGTSLLTTGQVRQKVSRALKEVVDRSDRPEGLERPMKKARKSSLVIKPEEPIGEIRETDVLTGNYRKRRGNALYKALLRQNAPRVGNEEMKIVVKTVVDGIYQQEPPGRFIREGGGSMLSRGQVHQKVARALREVVDRTSGVIGTPKPAELQRKEMLNLPLKQNQGHVDYNKNEPAGIKIEEQLMGPKLVTHSAGMQGQSVGMQRQSAGMQGQLVGMQGQLVGMHGQSVGMHGQSVGMHGQSVGMHEQSAGMQRQSSGMHVPSIGMHEPPGGMHGPSIGMQGPSIGMHGQYTGMQEQSIGMQEQSIGMQDQSIGMQDQSIGMQDQSIGMQEQSIGMQDQSIGMQDQSIGMQDQSIGMQDQSLGMQEQSVGMQEQSVGMQGQFGGMQEQSIGMQGHCGRMEEHCGAVGMQGHCGGMQEQPVGIQGQPMAVVKMEEQPVNMQLDIPDHDRQVEMAEV